MRKLTQYLKITTGVINFLNLIRKNFELVTKIFPILTLQM